MLPICGCADFLLILRSPTEHFTIDPQNPLISVSELRKMHLKADYEALKLRNIRRSH